MVMNIETRDILWVDDDAWHIKGLVYPLERQGNHITIVETLPEASEIVENNPTSFDIIILDILMPQTDQEGNVPDWLAVDAHDGAYGIVFLKRLRDKLNVWSPILLLSIIGDPIEEFALQDYEPLGFVRKQDLQPKDVFVAVETLLSAH